MTRAVWTQHYEADVETSVPEPQADQVFDGILKAAAAGAPGYRAVECFNRGVTFAELDALAERVATSLDADGFGPGSMALAALPTGLHMAVTALGVLRAGGALAPLPHDAADAVVESAVAGIEPAVVFTTPARGAVFAGAMASTGGRLVVVRPESALPLSLRWIRRLGSPLSSRRHGLNSRSAVAWSSWLSATADAPEQRVGASAPAVVHLSLDSGEQLCTFSHGQLICGAEQLRSWLTDALPGEDTWLLLDPLNTTLGIVVGLGTSIMLRSRLVLLPQWDARDVLDALRYVRPSYVAASGPSMARLARASELRQADTRSVRAWIVGDPLTAEVRWSFEEATGLSLCQGFGPPCTAGLATCNPVNSERARGSVGLPLPGVDARLVGKDGDQLPLGRQGILQLRGPNIAAENEWLDTGLEGRMDQRGFLFLNGD